MATSGLLSPKTPNSSRNIRDFLFDSGSTAHMTATKEGMYDNEIVKLDVTLADGSLVPVHERGKLKVHVTDSHGRSHILIMEGVLWVPSIKKTLFSVPAFVRHIGNSVSFFQDRIELTVAGIINVSLPGNNFSSIASAAAVIASDHNTLNTKHSHTYLPGLPAYAYVTVISPVNTQDNINGNTRFTNTYGITPNIPHVLAIPEPETTFTKKKIHDSLLHRRMGHISYNTLLYKSKTDVWKDVSILSSGSTFCDPCHVTVVPKARHSHVRITLPSQAGDIVAFHPVPSPWRDHPLTKECNFPVGLFCVDVCTKRCEFIGMRSKATKHIIEAIITYEQRCGVNIRAIHSDAGDEFFSAELLAWLVRRTAQGTPTRRHLAAPDTQWQKGFCERHWGHIKIMAHKMCVNARLSLQFAFYAIEAACYIHARYHTPAS
jgi:hypothetical protein